MLHLRDYVRWALDLTTNTCSFHVFSPVQTLSTSSVPSIHHHHSTPLLPVPPSFPPSPPHYPSLSSTSPDLPLLQENSLYLALTSPSTSRYPGRWREPCGADGMCVADSLTLFPTGAWPLSLSVVCGCGSMCRSCCLFVCSVVFMML